AVYVEAEARSTQNPKSNLERYSSLDENGAYSKYLLSQEDVQAVQNAIWSSAYLDDLRGIDPGKYEGSGRSALVALDRELEPAGDSIRQLRWDTLGSESTSG